MSNPLRRGRRSLRGDSTADPRLQHRGRSSGARGGGESPRRRSRLPPILWDGRLRHGGATSANTVHISRLWSIAPSGHSVTVSPVARDRASASNRVHGGYQLTRWSDQASGRSDAYSGRVSGQGQGRSRVQPPGMTGSCCEPSGCIAQMPLGCRSEVNSRCCPSEDQVGLESSPGLRVRRTGSDPLAFHHPDLTIPAAVRGVGDLAPVGSHLGQHVPGRMVRQVHGIRSVDGHGVDLLLFAVAQRQEQQARPVREPGGLPVGLPMRELHGITVPRHGDREHLERAIGGVGVDHGALAVW